MAKCKSCSKKNGVYGIEDAKYTAIAAAVVGAVLTGKIDEAATINADGTMKDNYFANNPTAKNAAYLAGAIAISAFMPGEMYQGAAMGVASYAGYQLVQEMMKPDTPVVAGLAFRPPTNIAGVHGQNGRLRHLPGNYGIAPSLVASVDTPYEASNINRSQVMQEARKYNQAMKTPVSAFSGIEVGM